MAAHTYTITVNHTPSDKEAYHYEYNRARCTMTCSSGAAAVTFRTRSEKVFADLESPSSIYFYDALRKMYLLHAMRRGSRLRVKSITITIDDQSRTYADEDGFPFLHSMLTGSNRNLPKSWKEPAFLEVVLSKDKTAASSDLRFACLYAFLAAQGRQFEYEKFTCYWTAMNAHYNYLAHCYNQQAAAEGDRSLGEHNDRSFLGALLRVTDMGKEKTSQKHVTENRQEYGAMKNYLKNTEDPNALHADLHAHRTDKSYIPDGPLGAHLHKCITRTEMSAYAFILVDYAYYIRCNYLHGSKPAILFASAHDAELSAFRTLNIFLREYLKEAIPEMFQDGWFTEQMYDAIKRGIK